MQKEIYLFVFIATAVPKVSIARLPVIKHKPIIQAKARKEKNIQKKFLLIVTGTHKILLRAPKPISGLHIKMKIKKWPCVKMNLYILIAQCCNKLGDFDADSPEKRILYSLKHSNILHRSANLALDVEDELTKVGRIVNGSKAKASWYLGIAGHSNAEHSC